MTYSDSDSLDVEGSEVAPLHLPMLTRLWEGMAAPVQLVARHPVYRLDTGGVVEVQSTRCLILKMA